MTNLTTTVPKAIVPGLRKLIVDGLTMIPDYIPYVGNIDQSSMARETYKDYADPQSWEEVGENGQTPYGNKVDGYTTTFTPGEYKGGEEYSLTTIEDALYSNSPSKRRTQAIGKRYIEKMNKEFFSMFNNGFNTSYTSYGDNKPLFSTTHPVPDGSFTQSNAASSGGTPTHDNIEAGILSIQQSKDFSGELEGRSGNTIVLLAPPALRKTVIERLDSERISGEFSNTVNVHFGSKRINVQTKIPNGDYFMSQRYNLGLLICPWLSAAAGGSDTAWFLIETDNHGMTLMKRIDLMINEKFDEVDTHALKVAGRARFAYGWYTWKGVWGSKGDDNAYAN